MVKCIDNLNLEQICNSGQCFRWNKVDDNCYDVVAFDKYLKITQKENKLDFSCSEKEWNEIWSEYFDLKTDYKSIGEVILNSEDEYLISAYKYGSGIRILRQDLWEVIVSFIISQNNNIKRIRNSVEAICKKAGYNVLDDAGNPLADKYRFPKPGEIEDDFFEDTTLGLGYRNEYLKRIYKYAGENGQWLDELKELSNSEAIEALKSHHGIGDKVANCICLFGLHHVNSFPIDTHIKQILSKYYADGFDFDRYKGFEGIVQQYMFYYKILG